MSPDQFWLLTPSELFKMYQHHIKTRKQIMDNMLYHAWHVAALSRQQKLPELSELLKSKPEQRKQTDDQMMAMARLLNAALGGKEV